MIDEDDFALKPLPATGSCFFLQKDSPVVGDISALQLNIPASAT